MEDRPHADAARRKAEADVDNKHDAQGAQRAQHEAEFREPPHVQAEARKAEEIKSKNETDSDKKRDPMKGTNENVTDTQTRSDSMASKTNPDAKETEKSKGVVKNMNMDDAHNLEETDEVSGPPGASVDKDDVKK